MDKDYEKLKFLSRISSTPYVQDVEFTDSNSDTVTVTNLPQLPDMIEVEIDGERYALWAYKIKS